MSFVVDQVRQIDGQLDRLQLSVHRAPVAPDDGFRASAEVHNPEKAARIAQLQALIKRLSTTSSPKHTLLPADRIADIIDEAAFSTSCSTCTHFFGQEERVEEFHVDDVSYEHELEWLLLGKASVQAYGAVIDAILKGTIPLTEDVWYWDDIISSYRYAGLYSVQTSPLRFWKWSQDIFHTVRLRGGHISQGWGQFYELVRVAVRERSIENIQRQVVSPLASIRNEARRKRAALLALRLRNANALGVLLGEGLSNESAHEEGIQTPGSFETRENRHKWKGTIAKGIALMDAVIHSVNSEVSVEKFDGVVASITHNDSYYELHESSGERIAASLRPADVAQRLRELLTYGLRDFSLGNNQAIKQSGRPSKLIRYWLPMSVFIVSSGTILRIVTNRKEEIVTWIREFGTTVIDFWTNWVVEPAKKVLGTIRHDESSEVSILSKRSLEGDRASLERMVVDFAIANPENGPLNESQIAEIRTKVREGDLTPVLKAYEKDLQRPIMGSMKGNLISALLIQIQKTKVDVEVAMSGIDSILKSQELLFGFIGLTPGVLVTIGVYRWLSAAFNNRRGLKKWSKQGELLMILRNIDRVLVGATITEFGEISYKDQGLLLCEVHLLRQAAGEIFPRRVFHDFLEEINELVDIRTGIERQRRVVDRIRWAYSKWLN